mgnify:CR=1 FL=1
MTRLGQMLMDEGMELKETDSNQKTYEKYEPDHWPDNERPGSSGR